MVNQVVLYIPPLFELSCLQVHEAKLLYDNDDVVLNMCVVL